MEVPEGIQELEKIKGVGPSIAEKLWKAGYTTIEAVATAPVRELMEKAKLGYDGALKLSVEARKLVAKDFVLALDVWERRKSLRRLSTGSRSLDEILGGGVETQAVTEFIGEYGAGKTQLCMTLSVMAQLPEEDGGLGGKVVYIDTEGTFIPERISQIASSMGLEPEEVLRNIIVARAYTSDHLMLLIDHLFDLCPRENVRLVVVDSIISHFRSEYIGRESLSERQQKLNRCLHKLLRLAEIYNTAVVLTNQVQANPSVMYGDPTRPAGGHVLAHACTHRVYLRKARKGVRIARILDSPYLPEAEARFVITERGIEDVEE